MEHGANEESISFSCKVSSVMNKNAKLFGKQFMFDGNDETCWSSDEGKYQKIAIMYEKPISFSSIHLQFQGGFASKECTLETSEDDSVSREILTFQNVNSLQIAQLNRSYTCKCIKLSFDKCYDTFGRIVIYHLFFKK